MFGNSSRRRRTHASHHSHHSGATVTTTTRTVETIPSHSHARRPGLMARLKGQRAAHSTRTMATPAIASSKGTGRKTAASRGSRFSRRPMTTTTTTTLGGSAAPRRKASMGSRVSGAMMKLRGSLSGRPALEAAGDRKMHGNTGPRARRYY